MIIFTDLSEVLIKGVYGVDQIIKERYGRKYAEAYLKRRDETDMFFYDLMRGRLTEHCFWNIFMQGSSWPFDEEDIKQILSENFALEIPGTLDVYQRIIEYPETTKKGAKLFPGRPDIWIISDHIAEREAELRDIHPEVFWLASRAIWSYDVRLTKGDVGFFERLLYDNRLTPEEVIFVDDLLINLSAASSAGIKSIGFSSARVLEEDLESFGFKLSPRH